MRVNKKDKCFVPREIKNRITERIETLLSIFEHSVGYVHYEIPDVYYNVGGTTSGYAYPFHNVIEFNPFILMDNVDLFIERTVAHELAHILAYKYFAIKCHYKVTSHGKYWKITMKHLGVSDENSTRCHSYAIKHKVKRQRRWAYTCECGKIFEMSTTMHRRMVLNTATKGKSGRICRKCRKPLTYMGKEIVKQ